MEEKAKTVAELLKVLANENRLLILCALMEGELSAGEIAEHLSGISQSGVSQHLSILKAHGILDNKKNGQTITYSICDERILEVMNVLKLQYCC